MRLSLLLALGVALSASSCAAQPAADVYVPPPGVDVRHYDLDLRLDPEALGLVGRVVIDVAHPDSLDALPLALTGLDADSVWVNGELVRAVQTAGRLTVPLPSGRTESRIAIAYGGAAAEGLYDGTHAAQQIVYTDSWPDRARGWMPGVHHPSDPATLDLSLTVPPGYEAVATGYPLGEEVLPGGSTRYRWRLDDAAPTYSYAFAVSDFAVTSASLGDSLSVRYYLMPADSAQVDALARTPDAITYLDSLLGPYAFDQYVTVQVPFGWGGMENASASFLNATMVAAGAAMETQVHEIAHQWFGDRVVIADWRDLWLSEGMATYLTTLFYEHADGPEAAARLWIDMAALTDDRRASLTPLVPPGPVDPNTYFSWVPYDRGGSALHILRLTLGDETFFRALRTTYERYDGRALSTEAFKTLLEAESGRDLTALFDVWIYREALPVLETTWDPASRRLAWRVEGDGGTLDDVPVRLQVEQDGARYGVPLHDGAMILSGTASPVVRPVGVMFDVQAGE